MGYLLDASALLAVLLHEPGHARVRGLIDGAAIHALNVAEVMAKLVGAGVPFEEARASIEELDLHVMETFTLHHAGECGRLIAATRKPGLSLGDCICLTAAAAAGATAVSGERRWKELEGMHLAGGQVRIEVVR